MSVRVEKRILTDEDAVRETEIEVRTGTVRCTGCNHFIRYDRLDDVETGLTRDGALHRRYVTCPGCGHERTLALSTTAFDRE